jgi:NAD+ kinase
LTRIVVVPKPLDALPTVKEPTGNDPESRAIAQRIGLARAEHAATIAAIGEWLGGTDLDVSWARSPSDRAVADASLVVTIGGDGTFLTVARHVSSAPMLGVNSSPSTSTGHYCGTTASTFAAAIDHILSGAAKPTPLTRIEATLGSERIRPFALNDLLFAHRSPVASSRYALRVGDQSELQLSSGIWVATATGSTAAIMSAGGSAMALDDPRLQYRVREPYQRGDNRFALTAGFCEHLEIVSRSDRNAIFLDGHQDGLIVPFGTRVTVGIAPEPLFAFLTPEKLC